MSAFKCAAHVGATAIALGLSLAVSSGVATADGSQPGPQTAPAATADAAAPQSESPAARHPARETRADNRAARAESKPNRTPRESPRSAARLVAPASDSTGREQTAPKSSTAVTPRTPSSAAQAAPASEAPAVAPVVRRALRTPSTSDVLSTPARARAVASATDPFSTLLSPIQGFVEGIALLVRRTFFNQAPSMSPVQLTGQSQGLITGNLGAVDPEADPIVYSITRSAQYGSVVVGTDGSYTYTPGQNFSGTDTFTVAATDTGFHINLLDLFRAASTSASVAVKQGAAATASRLQFQFIYGSGSQLWSTAARSSLESAASVLSTHIVATTPVVITFNVTGEFSPLSTTLATAGSEFISSDPGFLPTVVQNKILTGVDSNGSTADGEITWNFARQWATGDVIDYSQFDLEAVATHELLHTLGFLSYVNVPGSNNGQSWTVFDSFLVTADGTKVIGSDFTWNTSYDPNLTGGNGGLYFGGADAVAAYGARVPLYTPSPWESGSSVSHLDDRTFVGVNRKMMNSQVRVGRGIRDLSSVELGILADLGYTVV
ncbi:MAG: Ig-like domain-containing protein [Mycobacterium sp.]